jgi:diaminopimelate epimerase
VIPFDKYHALGNDYIVVNPADISEALSPAVIKVLCDRHYGIGSDGVLLGPISCDGADFGLRIFNPDGSEAEKSGNGLRIFCRYLWDQKLVGDSVFRVKTLGGIVKAIVYSGGKSVSVEMGKVFFNHERFEGDISVHSLIIDEQVFDYYPASVGNPHCVILMDNPTPEIANRLGPKIEQHAKFANRTNVQFVKVVDRQNIEIEIWERGAGYTLASGSSSTAAAAVVHALGICDSNISVQMPGGIIEIAIDDQHHATMTGPVCRIGDGNLSAEAINN